MRLGLRLPFWAAVSGYDFESTTNVQCTMNQTRQAIKPGSALPRRPRDIGRSRRRPMPWGGRVRSPKITLDLARHGERLMGVVLPQQCEATTPYL